MMRDLLGLGSMLMPQAIAFGLDLALKSTVILLPVFCIHKLLGGRRALTRSALWNACLVGLLTLPAFIALSPRWRIQALGRIVGERNASTISVDLSNDRPRIQEPVKHTQIPLPDQPRDFLNAHRNLPGVGESFAHLAERGPDNRLAGQAKPTDSAASDRPVWIGLFVTGYVLVAAVLALRLLAAFVSVARLRRNSVVMNIGTWNEALEHWRNWLKIGTAVSLDRSPDVSIPVTIGWQWPAILVPDSLSETDDPKLANAVLLHELCHIRRADYAWNIAWKAAQIIYWPQPLIWLAGRVVRDVREQACDELCVHALGGDSPTARLWSRLPPG